MRGSDKQTGSLFSYVNLEERVPSRHPLRKIKGVVDAALVSLDADFERVYAGDGRPSIAPERLMRAALVQILFSIRSEAAHGAARSTTCFLSLVRGVVDRRAGVGARRVHQEPRSALTTEMSRKLMAAILAHEKVAPLLSDDHFSVDGTLVEAWASFKLQAEGHGGELRGRQASRRPMMEMPAGQARLVRRGRTGQQDESKMGKVDKGSPDRAIGRNTEHATGAGSPGQAATRVRHRSRRAALPQRERAKPALALAMGHALTRTATASWSRLPHADGTARKRRAAISHADAFDPGSTRAA